MISFELQLLTIHDKDSSTLPTQPHPFYAEVSIAESSVTALEEDMVIAVDTVVPGRGPVVDRPESAAMLARETVDAVAPVTVTLDAETGTGESTGACGGDT